MDERDFSAHNHGVKKELFLNHPIKMVSIAYTDNNTKDLYAYYFIFEMGNMKIHSIDVWRKNGKSGNTFKHQEVFHFEYKKKILNQETGKFEEPKIPIDVWRNASNCFKGYLINSL